MVKQKQEKKAEEREKQEKKIGLTVKKNEDFSEWYSQLCSEQGAQLVDLRYGVQGFVVYREWGYSLLKKIYSLFEEAVEADNHEAFLFPVVIPEENLQKEKEHAGFTPEVFWVTQAGDAKLEKPLALRPTGETALYPMYSLWIRSYKDLPYKRYQSRIMVYRNEMTTRPFIRGREFCFFETHDVFRTHQEAVDQIKQDMRIMQQVTRNRLFIPFIFFCRPKWDKFLGADDTYASDTLMPDGKRNQLSSTHDLGHNFAKAFDVSFTDEDGGKKFAFQTCFGPGIIRHVAALIAIHGDDRGLILPSAIAPLQVVIVPIVFSSQPELARKVWDRCAEVESRIKKLRYSAKFDDSDNSPGFKYNQWELRGVPLRIEIGPKEVEERTVTIVRRTDRKKIPVHLTNLDEELQKNLVEVDSQIKKAAESYFQDNTKEATTLNGLKTILKKHKGFVKVPFCSVETDGKECADTLKTETVGGCVSGTKFENPEIPHQGDKCVICGKKAKHIVYVAKSY